MCVTIFEEYIGKDGKIIAATSVSADYNITFTRFDSYHKNIDIFEDTDYVYPLDNVEVARQELYDVKVSQDKPVGHLNSAATSSNYQHLKAPVLLASLCWAKNVSNPDIAVQTNIYTL